MARMSRTELIVLAGLGSLAGLALSPSAVNAQTSESANGPAFLEGSGSQATRGTGGVVFSDLLISSISIRGGRTVATTRTDGQGGFRFDLPPGAYNICLNGPGLRSAIDRGGGSQGDDQIIGILIGLLIPAVQSPPTEQRLTFPGGSASGQAGGRGPSGDRDLCFPYTAVASAGTGGQTTRGQRVMPDGSIISTGDPEFGTAGSIGDPHETTGDGRADRRVDPRIPPPGAGAAPARPAAPQTVTVTGTIRYLFGLRGSAL
ncbi:hypothetical protein [Brevundimonas sp.]|uniref:hypothetical protein n=1 Tax=Brevundimonas sp. TaxID=1871086 RepID=UPI002730335B|nr:hypothetical protein [Brevundimonas sp.]MDP1914251.1 hypothetical protein [Brevundimonas sp.]